MQINAALARPTLRTINVGGELFTASTATWEGEKKATLKHLIDTAPPDPLGHPFIDRDPQSFRHILHGMRYGDLPPLSAADAAIMQQELDYYGMAHLGQDVRSLEQAGTAHDAMALAERSARAGNIETALEQISSAIALDPDAVRLRYESRLCIEKPTAFMHAALGEYYAKRDNDRAVGHLVSALIYEPDNCTYVHGLACQLTESKYPVDVIEGILRAQIRQGGLDTQQLYDSWMLLAVAYWGEVIAPDRDEEDSIAAWKRLQTMFSTIDNEEIQTKLRETFRNFGIARGILNFDGSERNDA